MCTCMRMLTRMTQATTDEALLTTQQAADRLGISRRMLYELISAGEIATIRIPSSRTPGRDGEHRIEPSALAAFIERQRRTG